MSPLLVAQDISWTFGSRRVLDQACLEIQHEEIVTLIGPNGAGKTTLLKILLGFFKPQKGTIWRHPNLIFGYMPQKIHVNPALPLTVEKFLQLSRKPVRTAHEVLNMVGMSHLLTASLHSLSGGEFQKILLAKALICRPSLLILDEPTQGMDVQGQDIFYQLIGALKSQIRCSILLISHDLHMVMSTSDRVFCLNKHICCVGHPSVLQRNPRYQTTSAQCMTTTQLAPYTHNHDHSHD